LVQAHISELNSQGKHLAMSSAARRDYLSFSPILSTVPAILEAVVGEADVAGEIHKVERMLQDRPRKADSSLSQYGDLPKGEA
jgi:hypothetical protein